MVRFGARLIPWSAWPSAALIVLVTASVCLSGAVVAAAATIRVTSTGDELVRHDGRCSLREAIAAVNSPGYRSDCGTAGRTANTIALGPGRYVLSIPRAGSDGNASGDLNLTAREPVVIIGDGPRSTIIDAAGLGDRVFTVGARARVRLSGLAVTGGAPVAPTGGTCAAGGPGANGGGILNAGALALNEVRVVGNRAGTSGCGGGIYSAGGLTVAASTIEDNQAGAGASGGAPGGSGGGIYSQGALTVVTSTVAGNRAGAGSSAGTGDAGGGIFSSAGQLRLINDTLTGNAAGGPGSGAAVAVVGGPSLLRNDTVSDNGAGGSLFVAPGGRADEMTLQNTIVAPSVGAGCVATPRWGIANGGHNLSEDGTCPGQRGDPKLAALGYYGGFTNTMALRPGSPAIGRVPRRGGHCPATDQRGVRRPQGRGCDIGAYEYAVPRITIPAPFHGASYGRGSLVRARFRCGEGGVASTIASCTGTVASGRRIPAGRVGRMRFVVTAVDRSGHRRRRTIHYRVWEYVNPLKMVSGLGTRRIDLGVDYSGSGPLVALGRARVTMASDSDDGPESCWAISCWPGGGIVVYRLLDGPFAGKYVYVAEHLTTTVRAGQIVRAGQRIATLLTGYPYLETGWAAGPGPEALAMADGHRCTCSDPGGWSTIEGRNMDGLLVTLGAPSGYLQSSVPDQSMPPGWPTWRR